MPGQRCRRWPSIKTDLIECVNWFRIMLVACSIMLSEHSIQQHKSYCKSSKSDQTPDLESVRHCGDRPWTSVDVSVDVRLWCLKTVPALKGLNRTHVYNSNYMSGNPGIFPVEREALYAVLILGQRRRRWPNIKTTLGQRLVFAGSVHYLPLVCHVPT